MNHHEKDCNMYVKLSTLTCKEISMPPQYACNETFSGPWGPRHEQSRVKMTRMLLHTF